MIAKNVILNDDRSMPCLGYGLWQISDAESESLVLSAIEAGYRQFDTAQAYYNEAGVGRAVSKTRVPRSQLFITSKLRGKDMGYASAIRSFEETLKRMRLDYLDLFLIHWPMPALDLYVETWKAIIELRDSGRVRSIGVSNFTASHVDRLIAETGVTPAINQLEVHPFFQQQQICSDHKQRSIVIQSYSPFGSSGAAVLRNETIRSIAAKQQCTPAQVVLSWHLQQGLVPLPRTSKVARMNENLASGNCHLDETDLARIRCLDRADGNTQPHPDQMNSSF